MSSRCSDCGAPLRPEIVGPGLVGVRCAACASGASTAAPRSAAPLPDVPPDVPGHALDDEEQTFVESESYSPGPGLRIVGASSPPPSPHAPQAGSRILLAAATAEEPDLTGMPAPHSRTVPRKKAFAGGGALLVLLSSVLPWFRSGGSKTSFGLPIKFLFDYKLPTFNGPKIGWLLLALAVAVIMASDGATWIVTSSIR